MKVCILGDNLTSLALAKALVKKEISVDLFYEKKNTKIDITRTIGISKSNIDFFNREITNIKKMLWPIKKIKIFTENSKEKEILKFEDQKDNLFSILQNQKIFNQLIIELKRSKFLKFKKYIKYKKSNYLSYDLIINCDIRNEITQFHLYPDSVPNCLSHLLNSSGRAVSTPMKDASTAIPRPSRMKAATRPGQRPAKSRAFSTSDGVM